MDDRLFFLQILAKLMEEEGIRCFFSDFPPKLDRDFWEQAGQEIKSEDSEALEQIASCLEENTSDFYCIEKITYLVESRGFHVIPRHT